MLRQRSAPMSPFITFLLYTALDAEPKLEPIAAPKHSLDEKVQNEWIAWCLQIPSITSLFIQIWPNVADLCKVFRNGIPISHCQLIRERFFMRSRAMHQDQMRNITMYQCSLSKLSRHQLKESSDALAKPTPPMMGKRDA